MELLNPAARLRGVFIEGELVGYISSHIVLDEAHIVTLAIERNHQRLGLGCLLLSDMIRILRGEGVQICTLYVRPSNIAALNLYKRFGFNVIGVRKHYYSDNGEDGVVMQCELKRDDSA
jgi:ribosomal-protein-alanine N-acetyltransferase